MPGFNPTGGEPTGAPDYSESGSFNPAWVVNSNVVIQHGATSAMKKNVAGQVIGCQLVSATDGSPVISGSTTVYITGNGGTQAAGSVGAGACTHEGNGYWTYTPSQAETNFDQIAFTFVNAAAIVGTAQVYPTFPQTGDSFGRIGAPAGASVSADIAAAKSDSSAIKAKTDNLPASPADESLVIAATSSIFNRIGAPAGASVSADIAAISTGSGLNAAGVRAAIGMASANLDAQLSAINTKTTNLPAAPADETLVIAATDAVMARIGAPVGASISADVAAVKVNTTAIATDTTNIKTRIPAALVGGWMDANMGAIGSSATAANNLEAGALALVPGTCAVGSTTTSIVTNLTEATNDHYNGRVITFNSGALTGQSTSISAYNGNTKTLTVVALTEAPAVADSFIIS